MEIHVPISPGELIDKIIILEIKKEKITDESKRINIETELKLLSEVLDTIPSTESLTELYRQLYLVNRSIWDNENNVREFWNDDQKFLKAARGSHFQNDERARVKREINTMLGSNIMEEKSHPKYEHKF